MSQMSRLPLPSIELVLTTDHTLIPRRPSVIKLGPPPAPHPAKVYVPQVDLMQTIRSCDEKPLPLPPADDLAVYKNRRRYVTFAEDNGPMDLAESIYEESEESVVEGRAVVVRKMVKEKISNLLFTFRRVLCVELPHTCLNKLSRH